MHFRHYKDTEMLVIVIHTRFETSNAVEVVSKLLNCDFFSGRPGDRSHVYVLMTANRRVGGYGC